MSIFNWFGQGNAIAEVKGGEAALTPAGQANDLSWEMPTDAARHGLPDAVLWAGERDFMPLASVSMERNGGGKVAEVGTFASPRGDLQDSYPTLEAGMLAAEAYAVQEIESAVVQPWADASESYYAKLADLAESRGADMERGTGFDMER